MTERSAEFRLAMIHAALFWPGVIISDGAFDVLRQVEEYRRRADDADGERTTEK